MATFVGYVASVLPRPFGAALSSGWFGVLNALTGNLIAEGMGIALRMPWLLEEESPDDVLPLVGAERGMPRYPDESVTNYRARLHDAWDAYKFAGSEGTISAQFAHAGYPGVEIYFDAAALGPRGEAAPYWSQFWIYFPYSSGHPVTATGPTWGSFTYGDGTIYGLSVSVAFYQLLHGIGGKWKPTRWYLRGFRFELADTSIVEIAFGL